MTYLLPWTPTFFTMLPPLPVLLLLIASGGFFILGLVMYMTSADMSIEDLLNLIPRVTVAVRKHLNRKKIIGLLLIVLGGLSTATFADQANAQYLTSSPGGGGPSVYQCADNTQIVSWTSGSSCNLCTTPGNVASGSTNCPVPCNNQITPPIVECDVSSGTGTGAQTLTVQINFAHAFTKLPTIELTPITASGLTVSSTSSVTLLATDPPLNVSSIPVGDNEIPNHRAELPSTLPANTLFTFCFLVTATTGLTAQGKIKYSTNSGSTWNDFTTNTPISLLSTGLICSSADSNSAALGAGTTWIAPFTTNGAPDNVLLTNISFWFTVSSWAWMSINVQHLGVTTSSFKWQVRSLVAFSSTFTISWKATACQSSTGAFIDCPAQ